METESLGRRRSARLAAIKANDNVANKQTKLACAEARSPSRRSKSSSKRERDAESAVKKTRSRSEPASDTAAPTVKRGQGRSGRSTSAKTNKIPVSPKVKKAVATANVADDVFSSSTSGSDEDGDYIPPSITPIRSRGRSRKTMSSQGSSRKTSKTLQLKDNESFNSFEEHSGNRSTPRTSSYKSRSSAVPSSGRGRKRKARADRVVVNDLTLPHEIQEQGPSPQDDLDQLRRNFKNGGVFADKWVIVEELDDVKIDRNVCASYLVTFDNKMAIARLFPLCFLSDVVVQVAFLQKMFTEGYESYFSSLLEYQIVTVHSLKFIFHLTVAREGLRLNSVFPSFPKTILEEQKPVNVMHIYRDACTSILTILELILKSGYVLLNIEPEMFGFDAWARRFYLYDSSQLALDFQFRGMDDPSKVNGGKPLSWRGCQRYAPRSWHKDNNNCMTQLDCLESFLYFILDLRFSQLPWDNVKVNIQDHEMAKMKQEFFDFCTRHMKYRTYPINKGVFGFCIALKRGSLFDVVQSDTLQFGKVRPQSMRGKRRECLASLMHFTSLKECIKEIFAMPPFFKSPLYIFERLKSSDASETVNIQLRHISVESASLKMIKDIETNELIEINQFKEKMKEEAELNEELIAAFVKTEEIESEEDSFKYLDELDDD